MSNIFKKIEMTQISNSSQVRFVCKQSNNSNVDNTIMISIGNEIINVLQLEENEYKEQIVNDLLQNGRQSLIKYEHDIVREIYEAEINGHQGKLIKLLKSYFQQQWKTQYGISNQWFISFLETFQNGKKHDLYEQVLTRTAEYGNKYMKNCPILSTVLQFLFEGIGDQCLKETNVFDDLWFTITNEGIQEITKYADYIDEDLMSEQINNKQSVLFQATRVYYRSKLFLLFKINNIEDKKNSYGLILDSVAEYGWLKGIQATQEMITPMRAYITLLKDIQLLLVKRKIPSTAENNTTVSTHIDSQSILKKKSPNPEEYEYTVTSFNSSSTIKVRFCPTNTTYNVRVSQDMTVRDVIIDVCRQAYMNIADDCYLWFNSCELNNHDTIFQVGLHRITSSINNLPEVRLKYVQVLEAVCHIGKQVFLASPEHIAYDQLLKIPLPSTEEYIAPNVLKLIVKQMAQHTSFSNKSSHKTNTIFVPLPNFSKQSIDSLPTIHLKVPLSPDQFDWNRFLNDLANDLEIDRNDLIIVNA